MKRCAKCKKLKDVIFFHRDSSKKDGYKNICKKCRSKKKFRMRLSDNRKRFDKNINTSIYRAIKFNKSGRLWERLLGYTLKELKSHIEKQFSSGMEWENYGSAWQIDKILPRSVFKYSNVNNNEFRKCWSLKNLRPLLKIECIKKRDKVIWKLVDKYHLYDILPLGLIIIDEGGINDQSVQKKPKAVPIVHKLKAIVKKFVDELENKKNFNEKLYNNILEKSIARNKKEILDDMVKQIRLFEDYGEEETNFNYTPFLQKLQQEKLDKD